MADLSEINIDILNGHCDYLRADGTRARHTTPPSGFARVSNVLRVSFCFPTNLLTIELRRGDVVKVEIDTLDAEDTVRRRPIVYLDQCHWSTLANRLFEPDRVTQRDQTAADRIISLARSNSIILPLSSGHMVETGATYNTKRQNLAATMLELSRGWQMRDPYAVRRAEIGRVLSDRYDMDAPSSVSTFTLSPDAMYMREGLELWGQRVPDMGLTKRLQYILECLVCICATYDLLMNRERIDTVNFSGWVQTYRNVAAALRPGGIPKKLRRNIAMRLVVEEMNEDLVSAAIDVGIPGAQFGEWCREHLRQDIELMPYCGLYADIIDFRLANLNSRWAENDFVDMLYLPCAASYSDAVAAERGATEYIRRVWRSRSAEPPVFAKLPELAEFLDGLTASN